MKRFWTTLILSLATISGVMAAPVKLSSFGTPEDGGAAFRKALDSGAREIVIDKQEKDWIFSPCELPSDLTVTIEKGVRITDDPEKAEKESPLFFAQEKQNITFTGSEDVEIRMHKQEYIKRRNAGNTDAVWNGREYVTKRTGAKPALTDAFSFRGCTGITLRKLKVFSSGGDGVYLGVTKAVNQCKDVLLEDLVLDDNTRMGVTIICAENVVIRRCAMNRSSGSMPMFGMDMEPGGAQGKLKNILLEDCLFEGNAGGGLVVCPQVPEVSVTVRGCTFKNNPSGFQINSGNPKFEGNHITVENCKIENTNHSSIAIRGHNHNYPVYFRNVELKNVMTPVWIRAEVPEVRDTGNIHFENVRIVDSPKVTKPFHFTPEMLAGANMRDVTGDITVNGTKYDIPAFIHQEGIDKADYHEAWPVDLSLAEPAFPRAKGPPVRFFQLYSSASYLIWAEDSNPLTFMLEGGNEKYRLEPVVTAPDKTETAYKAVPTALGKETYSILPRFRGVYNLKVAPGYAWVTFKPRDPFKWVIAATERDSFIIFGNLGKKLPLYFLFPKGVKKCWISVYAPRSPKTTVSIFDPAGKEQMKLAGFTYCPTFEISRTTEKEEVWSLVFNGSANYMALRLAGIPPYLADRKENVFRHRAAPRKAEPLKEAAGKPAADTLLDSILDD